MAAEVIIFPDVTQTVVNHLRARLAAAGFTLTVATEVPSPRPSPLVMVRRVGGVKRNIATDEPLVVVDCWADSPETAHDVAQYARGLINAMPRDGVALVRGVTEAGGPQFFPDPVTDAPRYTQTFQIAMAGSAV